MDEILFLAHRVPYPPNKGDKVRSFNEVKYLASRYTVHLGAFVDDPEDWRRVDELKFLCGETCLLPLNGQWARIKSAVGLVTGEALTLPYYRHARFAAWVDDILGRRSISCAVVYSSPMAQYLRRHRYLTRIVDFVDVDSDKWRQYADTKRWPLSWIYARESQKLARFEVAIASEFDATLLAAPPDAELMRSIAPQASLQIHCACNGVDAEYFSPAHAFPSPYPTGTQPIVFTGAMDYWPNIDAVEWFAREIFPAVRRVKSNVIFCVVGARPPPRIAKLAAILGLTVTGTVPDVRPYLANAKLAVAPLRIARGIQNKVLEAMAMAKPVVVSPQAAAGIAALPGQELMVADGALSFAKAIIALLDGDTVAIGEAARNRVLCDYSWSDNLAKLGSLLNAPVPRSPRAITSPKIAADQR